MSHVQLLILIEAAASVLILRGAVVASFPSVYPHTGCLFISSCKKKTCVASVAIAE